MYFLCIVLELYCIVPILFRYCLVYIALFVLPVQHRHFIKQSVIRYAYLCKSPLSVCVCGFFVLMGTKRSYSTHVGHVIFVTE